MKLNLKRKSLIQLVLCFFSNFFILSVTTSVAVLSQGQSFAAQEHRLLSHTLTPRGVRGFGELPRESVFVSSLIELRRDLLKKYAQPFRLLSFAELDDIDRKFPEYWSFLKKNDSLFEKAIENGLDVSIRLDQGGPMRAVEGGFERVLRDYKVQVLREQQGLISFHEYLEKARDVPEFEISAQQLEESEVSLKKMIHAAVLSLEEESDLSGPQRSKMVSFLRSMNPKLIVLRLNAWKNIYSKDKSFSEHAKNLSLILIGTELMELATLPVAVGLTSGADLPLWLDSTILGVAGFISVPFVLNASLVGPLAILGEPYCSTALALYAGSSRFRRFVTRIREFFESNLGKACQRLGLERYFNRYFPKIKGLESLLKAGWDLGLNERGEPLYLMKQNEDLSWVRFELGLDQEVYFIKSVEMNGVSRSAYSKMLQPLAHLTRLALKDAYDDQNIVLFRDREILIKNKRQFCKEKLLGGARGQ